MDNITHSLVGAVLGQTGLKKKTRKGMAALVLGANAPDIDVFFGGFPWQPLATHRGFTHGFLAVVLIMPLVVAGFLWLIDRWQARRGETFSGKPELDFRWLLGLALIGNLTHPLLDLQTTYAVQLLSPFSTVWYHTDTLFIIDIWLLALLGGTLWVSLRRERRNLEWRKPATTALTVMLVYLGVNGGITWAAKREVESQAVRIAASPPPVAFWLREVAWLRGGRYSWAGFDPLATPALAQQPHSQPANMGDPLVAEAIAASPAVQRFLRWSIMPFATIAREPCRATVTFNDARYSQGFSSGNFEHVVVLAIRGPGCP